MIGSAPPPPGPPAWEVVASPMSAGERAAADPRGGAAAAALAAGSDGAFLLAWEHHAEGEAVLLFRRREPGPEGDWGPVRRLDAGPGGARCLEPRLATGPGGLVVAAWQQGRAEGAGIRSNRSADGGRTWLATDAAVTSGSEGPATMPSLAVDAAGRVFAAWEDRRDGDRDIRVARSLDGGLRWEPGRRADSDPAGRGVSYHPQVLALPGDVVLVVWWDERDGLADLYVRRSTDAGVTWTGPETRLDPGPAGRAASRAARLAPEATSLAVEWEESFPDGRPRRVARTTTDGGASWTALAEAPAPRTPADAIAAITADGDTLLVRAAETAAGGEILASFRSGPSR